MGVQIGINPLTWTNDDMPSLGGNTPLEVCLMEGKEAGYQGFELGNKFPRNAEVLQPILAKYDLQLVSGWYSGFLLDRTVEEEIESAKQHLELLKAMDCKVFIFCELTHFVHGNPKIPLRHRRPFDVRRWNEYGKKLTAFAAHLLGEGVRLVYHHHMGTLIQNEAEINQLMENTGVEVSLLLDTGHAYCAGFNPLDLAKHWKNRIFHVHCKDIRQHVLDYTRNNNLSFLDAVLKGLFTVPGDGCIDYKSLFKFLKEIDYQGWLVVEAEQDPAIATPIRYARMGYENIVKLVSDTGLQLIHS